MSFRHDVAADDAARNQVGGDFIQRVAGFDEVSFVTEIEAGD